MALIKKGYQAHKFAVVESPHAGSTMIYLYQQPHDKNTLAPIMAEEAVLQGDGRGAPRQAGEL